MREFVYISERKLTQFVPEQRWFWQRFGLQKISAKAVGIEATIDLGPVPATSYTSLQKVMTHLDRDARWYGESQVAPGTWVYFDSLLYQTAVWLEPYELSAAVFLDVDPAPGERAPSRRLFLHGSGEHLVGVPVPTRQSCVTAEAPVATPGSMSTALGTGTWESLAFGLGYRDGPPTRVPGGTAVVDVPLLREVLRWMFSSFASDEYHRSQAGWVAGCARVTSIVDIGGTEVLTASPLYVERVAPPD